MFIIPGILISLITFPGVIAHEIAHRLFCDVTKTPVYGVCYFRPEGLVGYVIHEIPKSLLSSFLISIGPLIVNTILCMLLTFPAMITINTLGANDHNITFGILFWIGFSIGMHAFPSKKDMASFANQVKVAKEKRLLFIFANILTFLFMLANALRIIWFDFFYAFVVSMFLPLMFEII